MSTSVVDPARAAVWPEYDWATWIPDALHAAGVPVILEPGWATRGRPRSVGPFQPRGMLWHHDASEDGPSPEEAHYIAEVGRPPGTPPPLAQLWVCAGCKGAHAVGTWHVLAAGRANHAGLGDGWGVIRADEGNSDALGVETDHTTGEHWPAELLDSLRRGTAGIMARAGWKPADALAGHKEYAPGRKTDPDGLNMADERRRVAALIAELHHPAAGGPKPFEPFPGRHAFQVGTAHDAVTRLERRLHAAGFLPRPMTPAPLFTEATRRAVARFQASVPALAGDADGIPGPKTWRLLQVAARHARAAHA